MTEPTNQETVQSERQAPQQAPQVDQAALFAQMFQQQMGVSPEQFKTQQQTSQLQNAWGTSPAETQQRLQVLNGLAQANPGAAGLLNSIDGIKFAWDSFGQSAAQAAAKARFEGNSSAAPAFEGIESPWDFDEKTLLDMPEKEYEEKSLDIALATARGRVKAYDPFADGSRKMLRPGKRISTR